MAASSYNYGTTTGAERRTDPSDGQLYTLAELMNFYQGKKTKDWISKYWESRCTKNESSQIADLQAAATQLRRDHSDEKRALLNRANDRVKEAVERLTASPVIPFGKWKFFLLIQMTFLTVLIAGRYPSDFWKWHLLQYVLLLPVQAYRWVRLKNIALMTEFCWIANLSIGIYLAVNLMSPDALSATTSGILFRALFAFAYGPFAFAVLFGNPLVPHSIQHQAMLLIHLQPMITAFTLRFGATVNPTVNLVFPANETVGFKQYAIPPLIFIFFHLCVHSTFFLTYGVNIPKGWSTAFHQVLKKTNNGENWHQYIFGTIGDGGSERLRFLKLEAITSTAICLATLVTFPLYSHENGIPALCVLVACTIWSAWCGAEWYEERIEDVTHAVDTMIKA